MPVEEPAGHDSLLSQWADEEEVSNVSEATVWKGHLARAREQVRNKTSFRLLATFTY